MQEKLKLSGMLFLLRHADYDSGKNPGISDIGKRQATNLAYKIQGEINGNGGPVTIWSSSANRAKETAEVIHQELKADQLIIEPKLWSDNRHQEDFDWLKNQLSQHKEGTLIIISHLEYVHYFPSALGFRSNNAYYAEGVKIYDDKCVNFG